MCGIAGIVGAGPLGESAVAAVKRMCDAMIHRGPDGEGMWRSPSGHCVLGHRRLIILDPSPSAAQPMTTRDGQMCLTYNGEVYNYGELRHRLEQNGAKFRSSGDTEVVLHWLAEKGSEGLSQLHGMFAFGLWDERERSLLVARDPLGIKPLYWATTSINGSRITLFASEVRALLASGFVGSRLSEAGLESYLAYGSVQGPLTIVEGISELSPAHSMTVTPSAVSTSMSYWHPRYPIDGQRCPQDTNLRALLRESVSTHLVSDVPLGAFLSGGVDSSAVVSMMAACAPGRVRTLSVVLPHDSGKDEGRFARLVASTCGTDHQEVELAEEELPGLVGDALAAMDQPTIDGINTYVVSRAARRNGLTVALSGLGGDELFGGYPSFRDVPPAARRLGRIGSVGRRLAAAALGIAAHAGGQSRVVNKLRDLASAAPTVAGVYEARRRLFSDWQISDLVSHPLRKRDQVGVSNALRFEVAELAPLDAVSWLEMRTYMTNTLLRDSDVMGMANSLEIRLPLLDTPFVEAVQGLGPFVRARNPPKQALIEAALEKIPAEVWKRPKRGFELPIQQWLLGILRREVDDTIAAAESPPARRIWAAFRRSPARVGWSRPWAIYVLEKWRQIHRGSPTTDGVQQP